MPLKPMHDSIPMQDKKILIAEDEKPVSKALELKLSNAGYIVHPVFDGEEAVRAIEKGHYDLVLLDLVLPKIDGFGVLERIKSKGIKTPVIVTSNLSQDTDVKRTKELGAVDYFVKSDIPISEVVERVKRALVL